MWNAATKLRYICESPRLFEAHRNSRELAAVRSNFQLTHSKVGIKIELACLLEAFFVLGDSH